MRPRRAVSDGTGITSDTPCQGRRRQARSVDQQLEAIVLSRLETDQAGKAVWAALVLGAMEGQSALEALLDGHTRPSPDASVARAVAPLPTGVYLGRDHGRGLPWRGPARHPRAAARARAHAGGRPERVGQVELRRGARGGAHGRDVPVAGAIGGVAGGLAEPSSSRGAGAGAVPPRGGARPLHRVAPVGRGRLARRRGDGRADPRQAPDHARRPGLVGGPPDPPAAPLLRRAGRAAGREAVRALRRHGVDARARRPGRRAAPAPRGSAEPREEAQGSRRDPGQAPGSPSRSRRRARPTGRGGDRRARTGTSTASNGS